MRHDSFQCRLVVLEDEVGGRWSDTCVWLIRKLAAHHSKDAPPRLRKVTGENRWWGMLAVAAQDALAATLIDDAPH